MKPQEQSDLIDDIIKISQLGISHQEKRDHIKNRIVVFFKPIRKLLEYIGLKEGG